MADIGAALRAVLAADGTVSGLVSTRIYPDVMPQNPTYPLITYEQTEGQSAQHISGLSGLASAWFLVYSWAETRLQATALADAVRLALSRYSGTSASVVVRQIIPENNDTGTQRPVDGSGSYRYWHESEFLCWFCEATS